MPPQDEFLGPVVFAGNEVIREGEKEDPYLVRFEEGDPENPKVRDLVPPPPTTLTPSPLFRTGQISRDGISQ